MTKTLSITQARDELPTLVANTNKRWDEYEITVNGAPMAVLISKAQYDSWTETEEILADKSLMKAIREGEKELDEGKGLDWEKVKKNLKVHV